MDDKPAFEVKTPDNHYKIWADGRVDGFPGRALVINRIPEVVAEAVDHALENAAEEY